MKYRRLVIALPLACAALATLASAASSASKADQFGVGLKLGKVVHSIQPGATQGPWLVWNKSKCSYQRTNKHPKTYRADVRKVVGGPTTFGYLHYGDTDPFGVANTKSINKMAALAGFKINRYNMKYPSETEPLVQARNAITRHEVAVLQGQLIATLNKAFLKIVEKDGCMASLGMYNPVTGFLVPAFGSLWTESGSLQGEWMAREAKRRGWKPKDTALVSCTDPSVGAEVAKLFPAAEKALRANGFALPKANAFRLVCTYSATQSGQVRTTDWLTAHPNFKHLMLNTIDDERAQSVINALKQAGRLDKNQFTIATGADPLGQKQIRAGLETASVALFPDRWGEWIIPMMQDVMAGRPVPSFVGVKSVVLTKANLARYYK